jgi:hypothetical protein
MIKKPLDKPAQLDFAANRAPFLVVIVGTIN